jgi:hypothetical protein
LENTAKTTIMNTKVRPAKQPMAMPYPGHRK